MELSEPGAGEPPLADLTGIQFGLMTNEDILKVSVFERSQSIERRKDLWDPRLGLHAVLGNVARCGTCSAGKPGNCEGHFGHITLPMPVYHPLHVRLVHKILSQICVACYRYKEKKGPKCLLDLDEGYVPIIKGTDRVKSGSTHEQAENLHQNNHQVKRIERKTHVTAVIDISSDEDTPLMFSRLKRRSRLKVKSADKLTPDAKHQKAAKSKTAKYMTSVPSTCGTSDTSDNLEDGCKYCGANIKDPDGRYPGLILKLIKKEDQERSETIEMIVDIKDDTLPSDYWNFVDGHPGGHKETRFLFPFEAYKILERIPAEVIRRLGMHELVARPEALILRSLPVPPSCLRVKERDSKLVSLQEFQSDDQHKRLEALSVKIRAIQSGRAGKPHFAASKSEVMELQSLVARYFMGCKMERGLQTMNPDQGPLKEEKLMKGHVLAKRNDASARCVIIGDPSILIEEISIPLDMVGHLTIPERVTHRNHNRLQHYVKNGPHPHFMRTGAVRYVRGSMKVELRTTSEEMSLEIGDLVHRHLKEGDLVIVNRPPSLHKHSLMALRVRMHSSSTFAINPLICAPFQADFDGDAMHVFVPQSAEAMAELRELMNVPDQLISPQSGQANSSLTEDSRLGVHLMTSSHVFLDKIEMCQHRMWLSKLLPIPAIVKSPSGRGPFWTGAQLFSMTLPAGINYRLAHRKHPKHSDKGVLVSNGELLVCSGVSDWLDNSTDGIVCSISDIAGPSAALNHLNCAQALSNQWLFAHGLVWGYWIFS